MSEAWRTYLGMWETFFDIVPGWAVLVYVAAMRLLWRRHVRRMAVRRIVQAETDWPGRELSAEHRERIRRREMGW